MERKTSPLVDGHPNHKAKLVKKAVAKNQDRIELFFLPFEAPALNPDEVNWLHVKAMR